jgi:cell division septation protein DedD
VAVAAPAPVKPAPVAVAAPAPAKPAESKAAPAVAGGPWLVEAGTFLSASALKSAEKKIRGLGYEPQITTTQKSVRMTRLRLGSFPEGEVKEALAYARGIAPDAFALRSGETFTVYAGTFTNPQNIREMTQRLVGEGVQVEEELLEVKRTISLVRFGGFANQGAAAEAATRARKAGIAAEVVNPR